jgi:hypothetical protein
MSLIGYFGEDINLTEDDEVPTYHYRTVPTPEAALDGVVTGLPRVSRGYS